MWVLQQDTTFILDLGDDIPDFFDWKCVQKLVDLLEIFYDIIIRIISSYYVTSNTFLLKYLTCTAYFFTETFDLHYMLSKW